MKTRHTFLPLSLVLLAAAAPGPSAAAQDPQPDRQAYTAEWFDRFSPVTALDIVSQLPGFELSEGDTSRRGLADSFGNLLIDGVRPTNKSVSLTTLLQRIPASSVERVELLQGPVPGLDRAGHALIANIVLGTDDADGHGSYRLIWRQFGSERSMPAGALSRTLPLSSGELTLGLETSFWSPRHTRSRVLGGPTGAFVSRSLEEDQYFDRELTPSASLDLDLGEAGTLRLDGQVRFWTWHRNFFQQTSDRPGTDAATRFADSQTEDHGADYRLSASWERAFGENLTSRSVLLLRRDLNHEGPQRYRLFSADEGLESTEIYRFDSVRSEYSLRHALIRRSGNQTLEWGVELTRNTDDSLLDIRLDTGGGPVPVPLPIAQTDIVEDRGEIFARHVWTVSGRLNLTTGLRWEASHLEQGGDADQSRRLQYAKPSIAIDYRPGAGTRLRLAARRDVDQLDFSKFASSIDPSDNNATLGNPDYVPERSWIVEAEYERRWSENGVLLLGIEHQWRQDLDDWIAVITDDAVFDAPGNLGDGRLFRARAELSLPLTPLGLANSRLEARYAYLSTTVQDPLTLTDRGWSDLSAHTVALEFRQDLPAHGLAWGWTWDWRSDWEVFRARERQIHSVNEGDVNIFVERALPIGPTLRLGVDNLLNTPRGRDRVFYAGSRASGSINAIETRHAERGRILYLQLTGSF